jgi:hypothetical protein
LRQRQKKKVPYPHNNISFNIHPSHSLHTTDLAEFEAWFKDQIADRSELDNLKVSLSLSLSTFLSLHVILFSFYPSVHRS